MAIKERMSGNEAVSYAIRQINPDVMPAFPITPSTEIPQMVSTYIANGEMDTEFIPVESEHSSMSATIGAEAAGARSLTATSSAGLALMWEELLLAASNRLPLVMALVNRTLSGPININCDHSDGMGARDTGWIQIYAENNQEAYDNFIQAYPIAEDTRVHLPVMICQDGFITSHAVENITLLEDEAVKDFVGEYHPEEFLLNPGKPIAVGPYSVSNYAMEAKKNQEVALENSKEVIKEVAKKYKELTGRGFELFEEYKTEDADYIMLIMGSAAGTAKEAVDELRAEGKKVGVQNGTTHQKFIMDKHPEVTTVPYDSYQNAKLDLQNGRIDGVFGDTAVVTEWLKDNPKLAAVGDKVTDKDYFGTGLGIAVRQGNTELQQKFNAALEKVKKDGTYETIYNKWFQK